MQIAAVIFDYGCVLSLAPSQEDYEPLRKAIGVDPALFQEIYWRNRHAYDLDELSGTAYWHEVVRGGGAANSPRLLQELTTLDNQLWTTPNPVMIEWVRLLRARGLKTAIISNMPRNVGDYLRRKAPWIELFNFLCFSGEMKVAKPDPAIYRACLDSLGVPAAHALFIDDREVNVQPALAMGMHGVVFQSVERLQTDLTPYGLAASLADAKMSLASNPEPHTRL